MKTSREHLKIANAIYDWLNSYLPGLRTCSSHTINSYRVSMTLYIEYLQDIKGIRPVDFTSKVFSPKHIEDWLQWLVENRKCSNSTCNNRLASIRSFIRYLSKSDVEFTNLAIEAASIKSLKSTKRIIGGLTRDAVKSLLAAPDLSTPIGRRDLALFSLMYSTAARIDEVLSLKLSSLRLDCTRPSAIIYGKGGKFRTAYLLPKIVSILKSYIKEFHPINAAGDEFLFYSRTGNLRGKLSHEAISKRLKLYAEKAHGECSDVPLDMHCHLFRHAKASHWLEEGLNIVMIQKLLGHSSLNTTMVYIGITSDQESKALATLEDEEEQKLPKKWKIPRESKDLRDFLKLRTGKL